MNVRPPLKNGKRMYMPEMPSAIIAATCWKWSTLGMAGIGPPSCSGHSQPENRRFARPVSMLPRKWPESATTMTTYSTVNTTSIQTLICVSPIN